MLRFVVMCIFILSMLSCSEQNTGKTVDRGSVENIDTSYSRYDKDLIRDMHTISIPGPFDQMNMLFGKMDREKHRSLMKDFFPMHRQSDVQNYTEEQKIIYVSLLATDYAFYLFGFGFEHDNVNLFSKYTRQIYDIFASLGYESVVKPLHRYYMSDDYNVRAEELQRDIHTLYVNGYKKILQEEDPVFFANFIAVSFLESLHLLYSVYTNNIADKEMIVEMIVDNKYVLENLVDFISKSNIHADIKQRFTSVYNTIIEIENISEDGTTSFDEEKLKAFFSLVEDNVTLYSALF